MTKLWSSETKMNRTIIMTLVLSSIVGAVACILVLLSIQLNQTVQKFQWELSEPDTYHITIDVSRQGTLLTIWAVVQNGAVIQSNYHKDNLMEGIKLDGPTVEDLFSLVDTWCGSEVWDCFVEFDAQYHYPKKIAVYDWLGISIRHLEACVQIDTCEAAR